MDRELRLYGNNLFSVRILQQNVGINRLKCHILGYSYNDIEAREDTCEDIPYYIDILWLQQIIVATSDWHIGYIICSLFESVKY